VRPSLKQAMKKGIKVVAYDSDAAPDCRQLFINQASSEEIGRSQVQHLAEQLGYKGEIAILSATPNATNQNTWIEFMKDELKKPEYKNMKLVKTPTGTTTTRSRSRRPRACCSRIRTSRASSRPPRSASPRPPATSATRSYKGKVADRPRHAEPDAQVRQGRHGRAVRAVEPGRPRLPGRVRRRGARLRADHRQAEGEKFTAGKLGEYTVGKNGEIILGPPTVFDKSNIDKFHF
jgi:rhamnose transport system substrate-binding protein